MHATPSETPYTQVWETRNIPCLLLAKSLLESAGIPYYIQGEEALQLLPLGDFGSGLFSHGIGALLFVPDPLADDARNLLHDLSSA